MKLILSTIGDVNEEGYECINIIKNEKKIDEYPDNSVDEILVHEKYGLLNALTEERALEILKKVVKKCRKKSHISMSVIDGYEVASMIHNRILSIDEFNSHLPKMKSLLNLAKILDIFQTNNIMILSMKKEGLFVQIQATRV